MNSDQANNGAHGRKLCRICGKDLSQLRRVRDKQGRYRCPTCVDAQAGGTPAGHEPEAQTAAGSAHGGAALDETGGGTGAIGLEFDPALAETKVDVEAIEAEVVPLAPPAFPERRETPADRRDDGDLHLVGQAEASAEYTGALGPRKRIHWSTAQEDAEEAAAEAAAAPPPAETPGPGLDPSEIPEDRSGLLRGAKASQLKAAGLATFVGVLAAAGVAFGISASPDKTMSAVAAAANSGISASVQAAGAVGVYALCTAIWIVPRLNWQVASARLAAFSAIMATVAIGLTQIPTVGLTLMWVVPLIGIVIALRKLVLTTWQDAVYCGLLIYAMQLGIRMALDADLWAKTPLNTLK